MPQRLNDKIVGIDAVLAAGNGATRALIVLVTPLHCLVPASVTPP